MQEDKTGSVMIIRIVTLHNILQLLTAEVTAVGCAIQDCMGSSENTMELHPMVFVCVYDKRFSVMVYRPGYRQS